MVRFALPVAGAVALLAAASAPAQDAPAKPGVDAPELAALGQHPVGVSDVEFVQPGQANPLQGHDQPVIADRRLPLKIWSPAAAPTSPWFGKASPAMNRAMVKPIPPSAPAPQS